MIAALVLAFFTIAGQDRPPTAEDLAAARALYASGSYEDALTRLASTKPVGATNGEVEQYRALCLLALGRVDEATRELDALATRAPLFKMSEADVSPRLVTMFKEARRRKLPAAARELYAQAKTNFERQAYATASIQFKELLVIVGDPDLTEADAKALSDLKLIGEGFMRLADVEVAAAEQRDAAAKAAASSAAAKAAIPPPPPRVFSEADKDVKPPVDVGTRVLPPWRPANAIEARQRPTGVLRIIVDEQGKVELASLVAPLVPSYDQTLLTAARQWQFRPATRNGEPVKYQKLISITLTTTTR